MNIKRIKNLKTSETEEKVKNEWNEIKSIRNRLLQNSDWIFVQDIEIDITCRELWFQWRKKVRSVDEFADPKKALQFLLDLQKRQPPVKYQNVKYQTVEHYRQELHKMLKEIIRKVILSVGDDFYSREMMLEKYNEASRYLNGTLEELNFIAVEAAFSGKEEKDVVESFLVDRENYLIRLTIVEKTKNRFLLKIDAVETFDECDTIKEELLILGSKKWI